MRDTKLGRLAASAAALGVLGLGASVAGGVTTAGPAGVAPVVAAVTSQLAGDGPAAAEEVTVRVLGDYGWD
jgi:hypothetical protein